MFKIDLQPDEKVLHMQRQTEWVLLRPVALSLLAIYLPWYFVIKYEMLAAFKGWLLLWTLAVLAYLINYFLLWVVNVCIITNQRVIAAKYLTLFHKRISDCALSQICNIEIASKGLMASMFNFGNLAVSPIGNPNAVEINNITRPMKLKNFISRLASQPGLGAGKAKAAITL